MVPAAFDPNTAFGRNQMTVLEGRAAVASAIVRRTRPRRSAAIELTYNSVAPNWHTTQSLQIT